MADQPDTSTEFAGWIGRSVESEDLITDGPVRRLAATLDHDGAHWASGLLPPLGHWLFHLPDSVRSMLGDDGHPVKGDLLPPIAQPRRMWGGGRLRFHAPVPIGTVLMKRTTIARIVDKANGMTIVTLHHNLSSGGLTAIEEEQDIVYLPAGAPAAARPGAPDIEPQDLSMVADAALLFRFSALTFNAHRIHYDLPYAQAVERYPALVVHGPLQAVLLMDRALREGPMPNRFDFRGHTPLYAGQPFTLARAGQASWIRDGNGRVTMSATIT